MYKDATPIKHFWLMQMLGNFGANLNLYFVFWLWPLPCPKNRSRTTEGTDIYRCYKQFQH